MSVVLETTVGDLTIDLFTEERPHCKYTYLPTNLLPKQC